MALAKAQEIISSTPVIVFSKSYCPYCVAVKKLFGDNKASFKAIELDNEVDGDQLQAALLEISGQRTVPNVFIKGKHIGGSDDTVKLHKSGNLMPLLIEAGAVTSSS